ncbi:hypothetical protein [Allomuricauda sp. NBRC 101325]|nr:hypothetical protein [Muricauda sp. NBRC 101325]
MKNLENFRVKELSIQEQKSIDGGFWGALFAFVVGAAIAIIGKALNN